MYYKLPTRPHEAKRGVADTYSLFFANLSHSLLKKSFDVSKILK